MKKGYVTNWWGLKSLPDMEVAVGGVTRENKRKWKDEPDYTVGWLLKHLDSGSKLLEFGCGIGRNTEKLVEHFDVTVLDHSQLMLDQLRVKVPILTFGGSFDIENVLFVYVLQHIPEEEIDGVIEYLLANKV